MMKSLQKNLPDLDELDLLLIRELQKDARASYATLASRMCTSPSTVSRRFNRLVEQGILAIAATPAYAALGYETMLYLAINTIPGTVNTLARQLTTINSIKYVWVTAGRYDILAVAMYRNLEEYIGAFPEEFGNIQANVKIETMLSLKVIKSSLNHLTHAGAAVPSHSRIKLRELDFCVIRELEKFPRAPVKELAHNIGASLPTVRTSLRKITSLGIIRITTNHSDPAIFGDATGGYTLVQIHPSNLKTVTDKLKTLSHVKYAVLTLGAFNCIIGTSFRNSNQMSDFIVRDLGNMPGVVHYETLILLTAHKNSLSLLNENRSGIESSQ